MEELLTVEVQMYKAALTKFLVPFNNESELIFCLLVVLCSEQVLDDCST